jgi:hypothetical protein
MQTEPTDTATMAPVTRRGRIAAGWSQAWRSSCETLALAGGMPLVDVGYGAVGAAAELSSLELPRP